MERLDRSDRAKAIIQEFINGQEEVFQKSDDVCAWAAGFSQSTQKFSKWNQKPTIYIQLCKLNPDGSYRSDAEGKYQLVAHVNNYEVDFRNVQSSSKLHRTIGARSISLFAKLCCVFCEVKDESPSSQRVLLASESPADEISKYTESLKREIWEGIFDCFIERTKQRRMNRQTWDEKRKLQ